MYRYFLVAIGLFAPVHSATADSSWYIGAGGSYTTLESKSFAVRSGLEAGLPDTESIVVDQFKDSPVGWQLFGGLMFTENFGFAVKYADSGAAKDQWNGTLTTIVDPGPPPVTTEQVVTFDGEMSVESITAYFIQTVPITNKIEFSLELGVTRQDIDFDWRPIAVSPPPAIPIGDFFALAAPGSGFSGPITGDDTGLAIGGVLRYKFVKYFAVSGEIEYANVDFGGLIDKPLRFSINGEFHF